MVVIVVISVEIEVCYVVAKLIHVIDATRFDRTTRIRRAHIRRKATKDVTKGRFILEHLITTLWLRDPAEVLMGPRMTRDLMTTSVHTLD